MPQGDPLEVITQKLDILVRLAALQVAFRVQQEGGKQKDQVETLGRAGLDNALIAEVVDADPSTVRATLSRARRAKRGQGNR